MVYLADILPSLEVSWSSNNKEDPNNITVWSKVNYEWEGPCGHNWMMSPHSIVRGATCPYCSGKRILRGFNDLASTDPLIADQWYFQKDGLSPHDVSRGSKTVVQWQCSKGHKWNSTVKNRAVLKRGCAVCSKKKVDTGNTDIASLYPELVKEWSENNPITPDKVAAGSNQVYEWVCSLGHTWKCRVSNRTYRKQGCPFCSGRKVLPGFNDLSTTLLQIAQEWNDETRLPQDFTSSSRVAVSWKCIKGHVWTARIDDRTRGRGCPLCSYEGGSSTGEKEIADFIISLLGVEQVLLHDRLILAGRELDIYIPSKNIAVEFNGIYWHSEQAGKDKYFHYKKWADSKEEGIQLITIWEDDWNDRKDTIKSMLRHKLGIVEKHIGARECRVVSLTKSQTDEFLELHHVQGSAKGSIRVGLMDKRTDDLVAVMVLTRRNPTTLELVRYATSLHVQGGQSKLLAWIDNNLDYDSMVTFADHEVSDGKLYEKTGWIREAVLPPDYKYVYGGKRQHKFNFRKARFKSKGLLFDPTMTESQLAELNKLLIVWDCGKTRYIRHRSIRP